MLPSKFEELLSFVAPDITKQPTEMRDPISAEQRFAITLRYLTAGDAHADNWRKLSSKSNHGGEIC